MLAISIIPDIALGVIAAVIGGLVRVVWVLAGRLSRLEGELGVTPSDRNE